MELYGLCFHIVAPAHAVVDRLSPEHTDAKGSPRVWNPLSVSGAIRGALTHGKGPLSRESYKSIKGTAEFKNLVNTVKAYDDVYFKQRIGAATTFKQQSN